MSENNDWFECSYRIDDKVVKEKFFKTEKKVKKWLNKILKKVLDISLENKNVIEISIFRMRYSTEKQRWLDVRDIIDT